MPFFSLKLALEICPFPLRFCSQNADFLMGVVSCDVMSMSHAHTQYKAVARGGGGSLGSEEPPQSVKGPPKGPLECTKRSTRMHKKVH